uniref:OrfX n=2 Tax=Sheep pulmonary adenomatosis virus TaxID=11746 RepID=Q95N65_JSRV|nr:OrfX [Jaagsiekte sheep retrovirus]
MFLLNKCFFNQLLMQPGNPMIYITKIVILYACNLKFLVKLHGKLLNLVLLVLNSLFSLNMVSTLEVYALITSGKQMLLTFLNLDVLNMFMFLLTLFPIFSWPLFTLENQHVTVFNIYCFVFLLQESLKPLKQIMDLGILAVLFNVFVFLFKFIIKQGFLIIHRDKVLWNEPINALNINY